MDGEKTNRSGKRRSSTGTKRKRTADSDNNNDGSSASKKKMSSDEDDLSISEQLKKLKSFFGQTMEDNRKKISEDNHRSIARISNKLEATQNELAEHKVDTRRELASLQRLSLIHI